MRNFRYVLEQIFPPKVLKRTRAARICSKWTWTYRVDILSNLMDIDRTTFAYPQPNGPPSNDIYVLSRLKDTIPHDNDV